MTRFGKSLIFRLTLAYGISILLIITLFTLGGTILVRQLAATMNARLSEADNRIDPLMASLKVNASNLRRMSPSIERQLTSRGVRVFVRDDHPHDRSRFFRPRDDAFLPPFDERANSREPFGPPSDHGYGAAPSTRMSRPANLDKIMSIILGVPPRMHFVSGGSIEIIPLPSSIGMPLDIFLAEISALGAALVIVAGVVGRSLTLRSFAPLRAVNQALAQLADGDFTTSSVPANADDEIGELADNYNRAAARVTRAIAEREQNERSMRNFIADASHELRTPLTVILGYMDALRFAAADRRESFDRIYEIISAEGNRMRLLIDNLNLLTKLDQEYVPRIEVINLADLARDVVLTQSLLQRDQRFVMRIEEDVLVTGNREELHAAVRNLVENALKYAPDGAVTLHTAYEAQEAIIEVSDEGPGIAPADLPRLFERFYRGEQQRDISGSGLGLPIVARAVQRAGGTIQVNYRYPQGTIFRLAFPRHAIS